MGPEILAPLTVFGSIVLIVLIAANAGTQRRKATLNTVEEAIRSGQELTPETIKALGMPRKDANGDLKWGLILVAVAASFLVLGWMLSFEDEEAFRIMSAVASFPGFIGLVLIGFGLMGKKKSDETED